MSLSFSINYLINIALYTNIIFKIPTKFNIINSQINMIYQNNSNKIYIHDSNLLHIKNFKISKKNLKLTNDFIKAVKSLNYNFVLGTS